MTSAMWSRRMEPWYAGPWAVRAWWECRRIINSARSTGRCGSWSIADRASLKLQAKISKGEQMRRVYDVAQTPLQRLLASGVLPEDRQRALRERVQQIDPLALSEHLDTLRHALLYGAHLPPLVSADGRAWPQLRFSLAACTSVPLPTSEEEPEQTDYQEAPSSSEDILSWLHTPHGPFAGVWEEILSLLQAHPEWTSAQILQEIGRQAPDRTVSAPSVRPCEPTGRNPGHQNSSREIPRSHAQRSCTALKQRSRLLSSMQRRRNLFL